MNKKYLAVEPLAYKKEMRFGIRDGIEISKNLGLSIFYIEPTYFLNYYIDWLIGILKSVKKLKKISKKYDGIICFSPFLLPLTFLTGKKIIFASTDFFEGETYQQKMKRIIYKLIKSLFIPKCSAVIATTNYTRKSFLGLVKKEKLFLIRNAIYVKDFKPKLRKNLNKIPILYYHGKIRDDYNVDLLINCLNYIDEKVELWLVGGGNALNRLKNISKKSRQKVKFFGIVPYERIPKIIKKADICLHPLPAFATKLWEYLAAGKPVVAVEGHKIKELIRNKVHAILTKDDPKDFAEGIKLLLHDKKLRIKLIKNGLKLVKRLDYSIITKQYEKLLDRL